MNSINYYKKYIKYKNKFLEIKKNLIGGYNLSDLKKGSMLDTVISNILTDSNNALYFKFNEQYKKNEGYGFDETLEYLSNNKDYNLILPYLLDKYMSNKPYTQIFYKENCEIISDFRNMIPYHVNIGALMFLSFITELEIFTLFHSIIPFNTNTENSRNSINAAFCDKEKEGTCTKTRIYRENVGDNIISLFSNFTKVLDETFSTFMNSLLINLWDKFFYIDMETIIECIVPLESSIYNKDSKWNFIFADWKERLYLLYLKLSKDKEEKKEITEIMAVINEAIIKTINDNEDFIMNYIAEATGFFSYIYLVNPEIKNKYFGSCITYSMFELYIMSRLHTRGENMILLVEKEETTKHPFWKITQLRTNIPILSHLATKFILGKKSYNLRSLFEENGLVELSFRDNKEKILKIFIYLIYDMYIQYFSTLKYDLLLNKINIFIYKRITFIEKKIGSFILELNLDKEIKDLLYLLFNNKKYIISKFEIDYIFKKNNIVNILLDIPDLHDEIRFCLKQNQNFYLVLHIVKIYPNNKIIEKRLNYTLLDDILDTSILEDDNIIVLELIDKLLERGCIITNDIRIMKKKNLKLYIILKQKINIPNLTLNDLIQFIKFDVKPYEEYIKNELLFNDCLIQQFNDYKIDGFSLLYLICKEENWFFLSILININKILKKSSINFNIINNDCTTLLNILQLKFPAIICYDMNIEDLINIILQQGQI